MFQETVKKRKPLQIVGIVVVVILALAIVSTFVVYGIFKDSNSAPSIFGKRVYIMSGSGMEPRIPQGAAVFVEEGTLPENEGNVILCNIDGKLALVGYVGSQTTTAEDGTVTTSYIVKYDSTSADQQWTVDEEDIIGRAVSYDTFLGGVITFASSKVGMLVIVIVPCALLIIYEVIMLILASRQKKAEQEEFAADMSFGNVDAFNINRSQFLDAESRTSGDSDLDFGFSSEQTEKSSAPKKDTPLFDFGDFTPKYTHTETEEPTATEPEPVATAEPEKPAEESFVWHSVTSTPAPKAVEPEPTVSAEPLAEPEPVVEPIAEPEQVAEPGPVPTVAETATKLDEVAKSLSSNEPAQATSSRIDELIKLLEEEKARLADKK
ncbi:MAG: hypothetical protein LIO49_08820 [Ruminococcus sp.]|nr:hypothetical protein [Ruminococcus sp.]